VNVLKSDNPRVRIRFDFVYVFGFVCRRLQGSSAEIQGSFVEIQGSSAQIQGSFAEMTGLFCGDAGLFCGDTGLFCGDIGSFCGDAGLFCGDAGLFCGDTDRVRIRCDLVDVFILAYIGLAAASCVCFRGGEGEGRGV